MKKCGEIDLNNGDKFEVRRKRPEDIHRDVTDYYNHNEISKYAKSKNIMNIQEKITIRALEILELTKNDAIILDLGCGPGFTGLYLNEIGYRIVSIDLIMDFLLYYDIKELNPLQSNMSFLPFRSQSFDAIISISALQWLCRNFNKQSTIDLMRNLAENTYDVLKPHSKAIFQFYPKNDIIMKEVGKIFIETTQFTGGFIIDSPNYPKKRRIYLILKKR